jgi:hypothetical protein
MAGSALPLQIAENNLTHCHYVSLHYRKDGEMRIALEETPASESCRCPLCQSNCRWTPLGEGGARRAPPLFGRPQSAPTPSLKQSADSGRIEGQPTASLVLVLLRSVPSSETPRTEDRARLDHPSGRVVSDKVADTCGATPTTASDSRVHALVRGGTVQGNGDRCQVLGHLVTGHDLYPSRSPV